MTENTLEKLAQLLEQDQFELIFSESGAGRGQDIRLVYLMNDAVESFLVFRDARMTGEYHAEYEGELEASLNKQGEEFVLVVKQGETVLTLFFEKMDLEVHLYEYAYTGHFWVKGYEYLRQLEYQLADVRDKYRYLGSSACTKKEITFMQLADFPPIKKYKSVPDAYYVPYPDAIYSEAVDYLIETAESVGDKRMAGMLQSYMKKPDTFKCNIIAAMLHRKAHSRFIDKIIMDVRNEADKYVNRQFDSDEEAQYEKVHKKALNAMNMYKKEGYECLLYKEEPFMYSKDSITYKEHVMVFKKGLINRKCEIYTYEV